MRSIGCFIINSGRRPSAHRRDIRKPTVLMVGDYLDQQRAPPVLGITRAPVPQVRVLRLDANLGCNVDQYL